ncbi:hypothetical protein JVT61DRAFT_717 [Boletus reticuloceps]|uniref:Uncharacterized protein n=1 Tax=Boletus reticuloceps TaxID=495285 RepID=A0A8I2Z1J7_9AGAM|nr:hypothetical protein JVT61DRAFT_717 [Boletus reticuloceps]
MAHRQLQSSDPLCGLSASWYIELVSSVNPTTYHPLANFSKVTFTDAVASDHNSQSYGPQGATISETVDNDTVVTFVTPGEYSVTIEYV